MRALLAIELELFFVIVVVPEVYAEEKRSARLFISADPLQLDCNIGYVYILSLHLLGCLLIHNVNLLSLLLLKHSILILRPLVLWNGLELREIEIFYFRCLPISHLECQFEHLVRDLGFDINLRQILDEFCEEIHIVVLVTCCEEPVFFPHCEDVL